MPVYVSPDLLSTLHSDNVFLDHPYCTFEDTVL
jgi:hypothetical protein